MLVVQQGRRRQRILPALHARERPADACSPTGAAATSSNAWSHDGRWIGYTSTRRNGTDSDLYVDRPAQPLDQPDGRAGPGRRLGRSPISRPTAASAVGDQLYLRSPNRTSICSISPAARMTPIGDHSRDIAYGGAEFAPDGTLWVTSDEGSDFQRLGRIDPATGRFTPVVTDINWDVDSFDIAEDGSFIAFVTNEAGISRLRLLDTRTGRARLVTGLPAGTIGGLEIAPWGAVGFSLTSARSPPTPIRSIRRRSPSPAGRAARPAASTPSVNVEPELIEVASFDGERVSGFLYRPDPRALPGPPAADRQHPWRARRPVAARLPRPQQLSDQRARHRHLLSQRPRLDRLRQALRQPRQRPGAAREFSVSDIGAFLDRLTGRSGARSGAASRSPAAPMAAICATPRRSATATRLRAANCVVAISNFVTFLENTQTYRRDLQARRIWRRARPASAPSCCGSAR